MEIKFKVFDKSKGEFWPKTYTAAELAASRQFPSNIETWYEFVPEPLIDEAIAYQWAAHCLKSLEGLVEAYKLQQVADRIASAIMEAARRE